MTEQRGPAKARILPFDADSIQRLAGALKRGELVAMPTETVYGLAGIATHAQALSQIFMTKERPQFDPLIVHVALEKPTLAELLKEDVVYHPDLSDLAVRRLDQLVRAFWPGPLTVVAPKTEVIPDLATSGMGTVALRMPRHPAAQALIRAVGKPLCAPSANRFGRISPTTAQDVMEELGDRISWILDGGPCEVGIESTIVQVAEDGELKLLRPGGIAAEEIERVLQTTLVRPTLGASASAANPALAPGMIASHYAPRKRLLLLPSTIAQMMTTPALPAPKPKKVALLALQGSPAIAAETLAEILECDVVACETLSERGDWAEAAQTFFAKLRKLDASEADAIVAEPIHATQGLAYAIADRLKRAAAPRSS